MILDAGLDRDGRSAIWAAIGRASVAIAVRRLSLEGVALRGCWFGFCFHGVDKWNVGTME